MRTRNGPKITYSDESKEVILSPLALIQQNGNGIPVICNAPGEILPIDTQASYDQTIVLINQGYTESKDDAGKVVKQNLMKDLLNTCLNKKP